MSHSPSQENDFANALNTQSAYRRQLNRLDRILNNGGSFSGNERNCAFLNLGPGSEGRVSFATISATAGLDFPDDGRAHALVDWDQDGDIDLWSMNRTAPRVRYLRNDQSSENRFVALHLTGVTCNRDAIGARVEVVYKDSNSTKNIVKSLRAGEGFLAQSSKWLHFGLGDADEIQKIIVHWPGDNPEEYLDIKTDCHYKIVQGRGLPVKVERERVAKLAEKKIELPVPETEAQILLTSPIPLPRLVFQDMAGNETSIDEFSDTPLLINLWASWCKPCLTEMKEFSDREEQLAEAGLSVLALSVDDIAISESKTNTNTESQSILADLGFPYSSGRVTRELVRRLQFLYDFPFSQEMEMPVPSSFLVDGSGRLAAIYRGPVSVDRLLNDVKKLKLSRKEFFDKALPFAGSWYDARIRFAPLAIPTDLLAHGFVLDASDYVEKNLVELKPQIGFSRLMGVLGDALAAQKEIKRALDLYRYGLKQDPENVSLMNNLAWYLATHEDDSIRNGAEAIRWAETAANITGRRSPSVLDTLAAAYAEESMYEKAVETIREAILLARSAENKELIESLEQTWKRYESRLPK